MLDEMPPKSKTKAKIKAKGNELALAMVPTSELEMQLDVSQLFSYYNLVYFSGALRACIVKWSGRLTRVAGTCSYESGGRCEIRLSEMLNKRHLVNDLKNTLLHEMIHAFLWNTEDNWDHADHGTSFKALMDHINSSTVVDDQRPPGGYNITLYHKYHGLDDNSKPHQWTCLSCGDLIKRSINRGPSPFDCVKRLGNLESCGTSCHWHKHKTLCGGHYKKIVEPSHSQHKKQVSASSEELDNDRPGGLLCHPSPTSAQKQNEEGLEELNEDEPGSLLHLLRKKRSRYKQKVEENEDLLDVRSKKVARSSPIAKDVSKTASNKKLDGDNSDNDGKRKATISANFSAVPMSTNKTASSCNLDDYHPTRENQNPTKAIESKGLAFEIPSEKTKGAVKSATENTSKFSIKEDLSAVRSGNVACSSPIAKDATKTASSKKRNVDSSDKNVKRKATIANFSAVPMGTNKTACSSKLDDYVPTRENQNPTKAIESKGLAFEIPSEKPEGVTKSATKKTSKVFVKKNSDDRRKGWNVIIKCLNYYSDELTDEDIEPLVNKRTERRKRQRLLNERIQMKKRQILQDAEADYGDDTTICNNLGCYRNVGVSKTHEGMDNLDVSGSADAARHASPLEAVKVIDISEDEWSTD